MSDRYKLRVVKTQGYQEQDAEEVLAIEVNGGSRDAETIYTHEATMFLVKQGIYPWRVRDERVWTGTGAAAEFHDVVIFLAGAGAGAFTAELGKSLAQLVQDIAKKAMGRSVEIGYSEALVIALNCHREHREFAAVIEMVKNENGNRVFRFADGVEVELDGRGKLAKLVAPSSAE